MKAAHLVKIQRRIDRVTQILLPDEVHRGEVTDPEDRLKKLIKRIDGWPDLPEGSSWRSAVRDIVQVLEVDVPAMIEAVREANKARYDAERALSMRAGTTYQVTITSDAPIAVLRQEVVEPRIPEGTCGLAGPCTKHGNYACDDIEPAEPAPVGQITVTPVPFKINWKAGDRD